MGFFKKTFLPKIKENKERKEKGEYNGIPFCYENYRNYTESIDKGVYYGLLSASGNAKSFWMRYSFIYQPLEFSKETGYKLKIILFALEDSKMQIYKKIVAHYLWVHKSIIISQKLLESKTDPLPDKYLEMIEEFEDFFDYFEENVYIFDSLTDPDSILEKCEEANAKYGDEYHMICIIDNYANISQGNYKSKYEAVTTLSSQHIRLNICKKMDWTVLAILQSDLETEKTAGRNAHTGNLGSIEPNLGSLGDVKVIVRDFHIIWALFNPWRYEIASYPHQKAGWNTEILRNRFRSLITLKNNLEEMAPRLGLYFEGSKGIFSELPAVDNEEELGKLYRHVLEQEKKIRESRSTKSI
jgi:hypothetical protein